MATALTKLKDQGWCITEGGIAKLTENGNISDYKSLLQTALNTDIREYGGGAFPFDLNKSGKIDSLAGGIVLQILKISNISAPKSNQESKSMPRLLKLELTDGSISYPGLEYETIPSITLSTPPGTKILLKNGPIKISNGFLLLAAKYIEVLGGRVEHLIEKWESYKLAQRFSRSVVKPNTGAPSWSLFGKNLDNLVDDKGFKSLTPEQEKENAEFTEMRKNAINEAINLQKQNRKVFGGGKIRIIDHNVQKIVDKGYTIDQAKYALKLSRNNLERAFASLKKQTNRNVEVNTTRVGSAVTNKFSKEDRYGKKNSKNVEPIQESKPSGKLSLFDFLEKKLPPPTESSTSAVTNQPTPVSTSSNYSKRYDTKPSTTSTASSTKYTQSRPTIPATQSIPPTTTTSSSSSSSSRPNDQVKTTNSSDRNKFENNISASFRQKKEDPIPSSISSNSIHQSNYNSHRNDNRNQYEDRQSQGSSSRRQNFAINSRPQNSMSSRGGYNNNTSSGGRSSAPVNNYQKNNPSSQSNAHVTKPQNDQRRAQSSTQSGPSQYSGSGERNTKNYDRGSHKSNQQPMQQRPSSYPSHQHSNVKPSPSPPASSKASITNIIDKTSKMSLNSNQSNSSKQDEQQKQPSNVSSPNNIPPMPVTTAMPVNNNFAKAFPQMNNGYGYNPYKIVGFQNKESNEFAMNILKHEQNFEFVQTQQQQQPQPMIAQQVITIPQQRNQTPQQIQNQPYHHPQNHQSQPHPQQIHIPQHPQGQQGFMWNVGDRCLAKYWEDGNFYVAEITGISERTFVVHYIEYGNFEEVLKHDILPLNTTEQYYSNNLMKAQHNSNIHRQAQNQNNNMNTRYREERPMYVPPAQRNK